MAVLRSTIFTGIRNSLAGSTFYTTPGNPICARARVTPINRNTVNQVSSREAFTQASAVWRSLNPAVQANWSALSGIVHSSNPSQWKTTNGRLCFLWMYSIQQLFYSQGWTVPHGQVTPHFLSFEASNVTSLTFDNPGPGITGIGITAYSWVPETTVCVCEISRGVYPSVNNWYRGYDWASTQTIVIPAAVFPVVPPSFNYGHFTGLIEGRRYFVRARLISISAVGIYVSLAWTGSFIAMVGY
jgi:hypothetical protein